MICGKNGKQYQMSVSNLRRGNQNISGGESRDDRANCGAPSNSILNLVPDCFIASHTLCIHRGQDWHAAVHIIKDDDLTFAVMQTMQPANVLLQCAAPGNRHGQKKSVEARVVEAFTDVTPGCQ